MYRSARYLWYWPGNYFGIRLERDPTESLTLTSNPYCLILTLNWKVQKRKTGLKSLMWKGAVFEVKRFASPSSIKPQFCVISDHSSIYPVKQLEVFPAVETSLWKCGHGSLFWANMLFLLPCQAKKSIVHLNLTDILLIITSQTCFWSFPHQLYTVICKIVTF